MQKRMQAMIAALTMTGLSSLANAAYIDTTFTSGMTTHVAGATVVDFDSGQPGNYTGQGSVTSGSISGQTAAPAGDVTKYLSVAYPLQTGSMTATLGASYNYFGLYWGSIDNYNTLAFYAGASLIATLTGSDVIASGTALGDQVSAGANRYVNFFFTGASFDKVVFSTSQYAFESDNHAYANVSKVPEPTNLALLGLGLAAVGGFAARRRQAAA
jgi:hypothetical protein